MEKTPGQAAANPEASELLEELTIDNLLERLGFLETNELSLLKQAALGAHLNGESEESKELRNHYQLVGEQIVNELQGEQYTKAQIGLIVAMGNLRRDTGRVDTYSGDLEDALMYATGMGYDDIIYVLEKELNEANKT